MDGLNIDVGLTDALAVGHNPDMNMKIKTESPRLAVTPCEWYLVLATTSNGFRQMEDIPNVIGAVKLDYRTVWDFPKMDSAAVGCSVVELNDMYFRQTSFPQIDSSSVSSGPVELDDMNFRRTSFPQEKFSAGREGDYKWQAPLASSSVCTLLWIDDLDISRESNSAEASSWYYRPPNYT